MISFKSILIFIFIYVAFAEAEIAVFCDTTELQDADWSGNFSLPKFDPNLGTLKTVEISLDFNLSQEVRTENTGPVNSSINSTTESVLTLLLPNGQEIKANASLDISQYLEPYDGAVDFSGSSGIDISQSSSSNNITYSLKDITDFVANNSGEDVLLGGMVESMQNSSVSGTGSSQIQTKARAGVCLAYGYDAGEF